MDVGVAHTLQGIGGKGRTIAAAAVEDDLGVFFRNPLLDVALEYASPQVLGAARMTGRIFALFTHVDELRSSLLNAASHFVDAHLANAGSRVLRQLEESRRMNGAEPPSSVE